VPPKSISVKRAGGGEGESMPYAMRRNNFFIKFVTNSSVIIVSRLVKLF
jgi:hypothetical protein